MFSVDAHRAGGKLSKRSSPVFLSFENEAAFVPAQFDEGKVSQRLESGEWNVPRNQRPSVPTLNGVVKFGLECGGLFAQSLSQFQTKRIDVSIVHVPSHAFAFGVPSQVVNGHTGGEQAPVLRKDLAACRGNGAHACGEFFSAVGPLLVLHGLDHQNSSKDPDPDQGQSHEDQPNASGIWHGAHSSVEIRMGGADGCSKPISAVDRAKRLCCN